MDKSYFVTITGINHYYGKKPFEIGRIVKLEKDKNNEYDCEAIKVILPYIDTIGYVANSANTVYKGTVSAGRLYDKFDDYCFGEIMFVTHSSAIAFVIDKENVDEGPKEKENDNKSKEKELIGFKNSNVKG